MTRSAIRATLAVVLIALFVSFAPGKFFNRAATIGQYEVDDSAQSRLYMWQATWGMVQSRPIVGGGFLVGFGFPKPLRRIISLGVPLALVAYKVKQSRSNGDGPSSDEI